jgi:putative ABC transport system permease protein
LDQARADLRGAAVRIAEGNPDANAGWSADAATLQSWLVPARFRQALMVLSAAIGCLLLLACANVANLLLAHTARRQGELRLRAALGARRGRLIRLLFSESALLAVLGSALGMLLARWLIFAIRAIGEGRVPRLEDVALQTPALAFAATAGLLSCVLFGIAPSLHGSHMDLRASLDHSPRFTRSGRRARGAIVAVEVALAMVLLTGAGLLAVSFARLASVDPGFTTANLLAVPIELQDATHDEDQAARFLTEITDRIKAIPGVDAAGATSTNPFRQFGFRNSVTPEEARAFAPASGLVQAGWRAVTPEFFSAARLPVIEGRAFAREDAGDDGRVVMLSQGLARQLWPDGSAVGRRILWGGLTGRPRTVIGVTGDIKDVSVEEDAVPMLFVPHAQVPLPSMTLLVRATTPERVAPLVRAALREVAPGMPLPAITSVDDNRARASSGPRFNAWLLGSFALIAAGLAATGIYAMLAFAISERRREIAVRLVLGARPATIVTMVFGEGARMTLAGIGAGLVAAALLTRYLETLLFEVRPSDPVIFAAGTLALVALAAAASLAPAWQASRIDPIEGLRRD